MGEVYRARDTKLQRDVAIKVLPELFALDPDRLARFKREAQVLASLNHPNIAAIYGFRGSQRHPRARAGARRGPDAGGRDRRTPFRGRGADPAARAWAVERRCAQRRGDKRWGPTRIGNRCRVAHRAADRRCARSGARGRRHAPRSQAGQCEGAARRHGEGAGLRAGEGAGSGRSWALAGKCDATPRR